MENNAHHPELPDGNGLKSPESLAAFKGAEAVVLYRRKYETHFTLLTQDTPPMTLLRPELIPLTGGYVIMPFVIDDATPILFIKPSAIRRFPLATPTGSRQAAYSDDREVQREAYACAFASAHKRLEDGDLKKIVLSRRLHIRLDNRVEGGHETLIARGTDYFQKVCRYRPGSFVSFWWTRQSGAWLIASPEPLLEKRKFNWGTVALAGTMPACDGEPADWSGKNKEEQAIVSRFIEEQLSATATEVRKSDTFSLRTGNIQHLCTDFSFSLPDASAARKLFIRLHPTPAVCGLPRTEALQAILQDETSPRRYYAGFSGPFLLQGETQLYVSLRCMSLDRNGATLYAGGGLMPDSVEEEEWEETQRKMQTMLQLF